MVCCGSGDGTPQSCTSAIPEMDFAFGSKNPTDVSQLAPLGVGVSNSLVSYKKEKKGERKAYQLIGLYSLITRNVCNVISRDLVQVTQLLNFYEYTLSYLV